MIGNASDTGVISDEPLKHTYPDRYPPGVHWATDAAWEILDTLPVGVLDDVQRAFIAGQIAGRLMRECGSARMVFTTKAVLK